MQPDLAASIGVNQNESRKNEEETHAHVADCCERPEPMRTAQRSHFVDVKQRHMKRGKKTQGSDCGQAGTDCFKAHKITYEFYASFVASCDRFRKRNPYPRN